jgi:FKBP-type peptidyl-prolyl cis-trans isomerase
MKLWYPAVALLAALACNDDITGLGPPSDPATETFAASLGVNISQMTKLPSGTYVRDLTVGTGGEVVTATDTVWVNYAGFLKDGKSFDTGTNIRFEPSGLIAGFRNGIVGMRGGGERLIVIPSDQGYGGATQREPGTGRIMIPRQSTLVFRVTLLRLHTPGA